MKLSIRLENNKLKTLTCFLMKFYTDFKGTEWEIITEKHFGWKELFLNFDTDEKTITLSDTHKWEYIGTYNELVSEIKANI